MNKSISFFVLGMASGLIIAGKCRGGAAHGGDIMSDTIIVTDTVIVEHPVERERIRIAEVVRPAVPAADSASSDTLMVRLPVERVVYRTDSFRAVLSGIEPRLDTLQFRRELTRITTTAMSKPSSRWGVSVTAGVAVTPHGITPALGVGVSYRLWSF